MPVISPILNPVLRSALRPAVTQAISSPVTPRPVNFVFFTFEGHAASRLMLMEFLKHNLVPRYIIEENSAFGRRSVKFYDDLFTNDNIPSISDLAANHDIERTTVDKLNCEQAMDILGKHNPSLIVLGKCGIIKPEVFKMAKYGCINTHPGLLPDIKGSYPQIWSVLNNIPIGETCHFIDADIDTGAIIKKTYVDVIAEDTLDDIIRKSTKSCAGSITGVLRSYRRNNGLESVPQVPDPDGICYRVPKEEDIQKAREKVDSGEYYNTVYKSQSSLFRPAV